MYCILIIRPALKDNKIVYFVGIVIFEIMLLLNLTETI